MSLAVITDTASYRSTDIDTMIYHDLPCLTDLMIYHDKDDKDNIPVVPHKAVAEVSE